MAAVNLRPSISTTTTTLPSIHAPKIKEGINEVDAERCTKLYRALESSNVELACELLYHGASPFVGISPFQFVLNDPPMILRLLGLPHTHELGRCQNFHEMMGALFPRHSTITSQSMKEAASIPPSEAMRSYLREMAPSRDKDSKDAGSEFSTPEQRLAYLEKTCLNGSAKKVIQSLSHVSPAFKLAWQNANTLAYLRNGKPVEVCIKLNFNKTCTYSIQDHSLDLCVLETLEETVRYIVTLTLRSLHRETFAHFYKHASPRETFTIIHAFIDFQIEQEAHKILKSIFSDQKAPTTDFNAYWGKINKDPASNVTHYRNYWDLCFFSKWARKFPDLLQASLDKANKLSLEAVVQKKDIPTARALIQQGALLTTRCLQFAKDNVPMLVVLLNMEAVSDRFKGCHKLRHICSTLFRKIKDLAPFMSQLQTKPSTEATVQFKKAMQSSQTKPVNIQEIQERVLKKMASENITVDPSFELQNVPLDLLVETLYESSPLFKELWDDARSPSFCHTPYLGSPMQYIPSRNLIELGEHSSFEALIESLIFGAHLALQGPEERLNNNSREAYAFTRTYHDYKIIQAKPALMKAFFGREIPTPSISLPEFWALSNTSKAGEIAPTEQYRRYWDFHYLPQYLKDHPDIILRKLGKKA